MPILYSRPPTPLHQLVAGRYRLLDLELTCWPGSLQRGWSGTDEYREIVQAGFIDFDYDPTSNCFIAISTYEAFCRPRFNPVLSHYFTALTGITNTHLASSAIPFCDIYHAVADNDRCLIANGDDVSILYENGLIHGLVFPELVGFDLRPLLASLLGIPPASCISADLTKVFPDSSKSLGRPHQAVHDCSCVRRARAFGLDCILIDRTPSTRMI